MSNTQTLINKFTEKQLSKATIAIQQELDSLGLEFPYLLFSNQFFTQFLQAKYPKYVSTLWSIFRDDVYISDDKNDYILNLELLELNSTTIETETPSMFFEVSLDFIDWNWATLNEDGIDVKVTDYLPH